jgi:hypothetical protein
MQKQSCGMGSVLRERGLGQRPCERLASHAERGGHSHCAGPSTGPRSSMDAALAASVAVFADDGGDPGGLTRH